MARRARVDMIETNLRVRRPRWLFASPRQLLTGSTVAELYSRVAVCLAADSSSASASFHQPAPRRDAKVKDKDYVRDVSFQRRCHRRPTLGRLSLGGPRMPRLLGNNDR